MKLYYGGAEIPAWREMLRDQQVTTVSLSYVGLQRRTQNSLQGYFPDSQQVFLDSGAYTFNKEESTYGFEDALETAAQYMDFIKENLKYVHMVSEFDARQLGQEYIEKFRKEFYASLPPDKFMPIWHPENGRDELERLCSSYSIVGVCQSDIHGDTSHVPLFNSYISRYNVRLHGVGITSKKLLEAVRWDSVSSTSWLSPSMYGDTFVWTGRELKRYPKTYKERARKTHRNIFESNGFNLARIEADDTYEVLRLSLWSWQQYINHISRVTTKAGNENTINAESAVNAVGTLAEKSGTASLSNEIVKPRETVSLPVMSTIFREEEDTEEPLPILKVRSDSMRVCNTCILKNTCPGYEEDSNCLYNIPIEVKTTVQLRALHDGLIEMQTQRVLFMKMAEDQSGGYADPNLSAEMDRLNRMIKTKIEGEKNTFSASINISESPQGPGFMEKLLGTEAVNKIRELEAPVHADDIIEAEVIEN